MYDSVITGKENASENWNCIISLFLTNFNIYFVFGYACFMCICLPIALWLFWDKFFFDENRLATLPYFSSVSVKCGQGQALVWSCEEFKKG